MACFSEGEASCLPRFMPRLMSSKERKKLKHQRLLRLAGVDSTRFSFSAVNMLMDASQPYRDPAAALGNMQMAFQELENGLIIVLASLVDLNDDRVGVIMATQLSFRRVAAVLDALCRHRTQNPELISQMESLLSESCRLEEERNKYAHSFYDLREIAGERITYERMKNRIKSRKGYSPDYDMLDTAKVDALSDRFRILITAVDLFFERLQEEGVVRDRSDHE